MSETQKIIKPKPFLRWAGGKTWFLKELADFIPSDGYNKYIEPFVGGGSVFFHLDPQNAYLSDLNPLLIDTYNALKDDVNGIIEELMKYENNETFYYRIRKEKPISEIQQAARFIYLNQTSFNGIYRENLKGEYNVPFGYRKKQFLDIEVLKSASNALQKANIFTRDFQDSFENIEARDLVFIDPPYTVTHNNNGFIKYNAKLFDLEAQHRLSKFIDEIKEIGAYYILTNAAHKDIRQIFEKQNDQIISTSRASLISGNASKRGQYEEFIFTNLTKTKI